MLPPDLILHSGKIITLDHSSRIAPAISVRPGQVVAVGDHAVYIRAVWGWWSRPPFPSVANSLALRRAGVTRDTPAPHNVEIVKDARGEPTGEFLERNFVPVLEYTLFRDLPRFKYSDRVESVRLGAHAYVASGTTSL